MIAILSAILSAEECEADRWRRLEPSDESEAAVGRRGCDFPAVELSPEDVRRLMWHGTLPARYAVSATAPLLLRRSADDNAAFRNATQKGLLLSTAGDALVGVDFPGRDWPPTRFWKGLPLSEHVAWQVARNWTLDERVHEGFDSRYLFGPSDSCETHVAMRTEGGTFPDKCGRCERARSCATADLCRRCKPRVDGAEPPDDQMWLPRDVIARFRCLASPVNNEPLMTTFGLGGPFSGIYFHSHSGVLNEVMHGQKLWLSYEEGAYRKLEATGVFERAAGEEAYVKGTDQRLTQCLQPPFCMHPMHSLIRALCVAPGEDERTSAWFVKHVLPSLAPHHQPARCLAEVGDVVYMPQTHTHLTMNLGETIFAVCAPVGRASSAQAAEFGSRPASSHG